MVEKRRSCSKIIVFKDNDSNLADTVFVYQTTKDALLLTKDRYEMGIQGGTIDVEVKSNVDFEVKISNDFNKIY